MKSEKERWIEEVLASTVGSQRAQPNPFLFSKIERQILNENTKIISLQTKRLAIAAACIVVVFNFYAMNQFVENNSIENYSLAFEVDSEEVLISDFNLYE